MFKKTLIILISFIGIFVFAKYSFAAEIKKTICSSGCDYTSLEAALNANEQDLTDFGGDYFLAEIQGGFEDTTNVSVDGWITAAANYIRIYTTAAARHSGLWSTSAYRNVSDATNDGHNIDVLDPYVRIEGLQIEDGSDRTYRNGINITETNVRVAYNIVRQTSATASNGGIRIYDADGTGFEVYNNIVYNFTATCIDGVSAASGVVFYNNTAYGCNNGFMTGYLDSKAVNNISYNNTTDDYDIEWAAGSDYNMSEDATAPGANSKDSGTGGNNPVFVNTGSGTEDFHIQSTSDAIGVGTDDPGSGLYSDDIDGDTRTSTWDMGADEGIFNVAPTITSVTDTPDPLGVGAKVSFALDWNDADSGELVRVVICKTYEMATSTASCSGGEWTSSPVFTNRDPETVSYTTVSGDAGSNNYYAYVCDDSADATTGCSSPTAGTFTVSNQRPDAPTGLLIEGYENSAVNVTDTTPEFSAVYNDSNDEGDIAATYCIQVNDAADFTGTDMWVSDSASCFTGSAIGSNVSEGSRSPDFSYAGTALSTNGSTYYWRIWFWDDGGDTLSRSATSTTGWFQMADTSGGGGGVRLRQGRLRGGVRLK